MINSHQPLITKTAAARDSTGTSRELKQNCGKNENENENRFYILFLGYDSGFNMGRDYWAWI